MPTTIIEKRHQCLLEWYAMHKRDLPFRQNKDPYRIWVSEIMAQQTRIEAMLGHYERFMKRYPTIEDLANGPEEELLKIWEGLGYYSRARNLKKAAIQVVQDYDGQLPRTKKELMKLPGIGDYTAGAISSIAFGQRESAMDGNVIRVYTRWYRLKEDVANLKVRKQIQKMVEHELPDAQQCGDWNQALMELGASVCMPRKADCAHCPMAQLCQSAFQEDVLSYPMKARQKAKAEETHQVVIQVARQAEHWYVCTRQRPATGLLAGLYEFDWDFPEKICRKLRLGRYDHVFTHKIWHMEGWLVETDWQEGMILWEDAIQSFAYPSALRPFLEKAQKGMETIWTNQ